MKALFVDPPGKVALRDVEEPSPREGEVLVRMKCCGVCGTDLEKVHGDALTSSVLGHEVVGEVAGIGMGVQTVEVGDRVFTHHHAPCYRCNLCKRGEYTLCEEFPKYNVVPGGFSEFYIVPRWNVERGAIIKLPGQVSYEDGSFIEPMGCCLRALKKVNAERFSSALIYGAGPTGLLHLKLLKHFGVKRVGIADVSDFRLSFALKVGADCSFDPRDQGQKRSALSLFEREGPELVVVATGNVSALQDGLGTVAKGGTVLLFGAPPKNSMIGLGLGPFFIGGVTLSASYSTSEKETTEAAQMLAESSFPVADLVTHRFQLAEAPRAFAAAMEQRCMKALVRG